MVWSDLLLRLGDEGGDVISRRALAADIGHVAFAPRDPGVAEHTIQLISARAYEGPTEALFLSAGRFADDHNASGDRTFAVDLAATRDPLNSRSRSRTLRHPLRYRSLCT